MYSTQRQIEAERRRTKEKEAEFRARVIQGLFLAPLIFCSPYIVLWLMIIIFK